MKKSRHYLSLASLFIILASFIVLKYNTDKKKQVAGIDVLIERTGAAALTEEWKFTKKRAYDLLKAVRINSSDTKSRLALAGLYIQEARITGNYAHYDRAAMKFINEVLEKEPRHFEALTIKAVIELSQHHFTDGLKTAIGAKAINPYNAFLYGVLVDASIETGNYDSAVAYADKMISIRPDIRSYSRISYLREIYGDHAGAIEAMQMAVDAGLPGDEATEWTRVQLAKLHEQTGNISRALALYTIALEERPGYAPAISGLARVATSEKKYEQAIALYKKADSLIIDPLIKEEMAEVFALAGKNQEANTLYKELIRLLSNEVMNADKDETIGHYADQELAHAFINTNNYDKALHHALQEYNRRPANIDANETLAWVYYQGTDAKKALPYITEALKTGCRNPRLLCRAGLIYHKAGDLSKAKIYLKEGLKNDPVMNEIVKHQALAILETL